VVGVVYKSLALIENASARGVVFTEDVQKMRVSKVDMLLDALI